MPRPLEQLRSQVLTLSEQDRAELAHDLLQSLDAPADEGVEEAWELELLRRVKQIDSGQAKLLDRAEFKQRMHASIGTQ
ncbi:addiction module protein [Haliea sp. AH-315-K21]|uniref:Addiction module protein n=1 Tax=SAR86 cluster bacterium TaxID=2030880 RepID=A0A2A5CA98_9GAMM|nr:addiction module protein [Haliea sp. AH-315-K21]MBN4075773.1 addiction module protein [Gammaproteobacteria bacterium AH-315-E17]PCJ40418.1 MAG: hypothetical protein COA71_11220 [SAR86 cluster bacterium]